MANDTLELVREAQRQGLAVEQRTNGWFVRNPLEPGALVMIHKTPSDQRALQNTVSRLKRIGFRVDEALRSLSKQKSSAVSPFAGPPCRICGEATKELANQYACPSCGAIEYKAKAGEEEEQREEVREVAETTTAAHLRTKKPCPYCGYETTPGPLGIHVKAHHPDKLDDWFENHVTTKSRAERVSRERSKPAGRRGPGRPRKQAPVENGELDISMLEGFIAEFQAMKARNAELEAKVEQFETWLSMAKELSA